MAPYGNQNSKGKGVTTASSDPNGGPSKRTLQNRKAQREFRKRREARVRELEERCRRYDELGLEANVELQRVARRLKDENDALRNLIINLGHGKLIPSALESVHQQPQTPSGGAGSSHHSLLNFDSSRADNADNTSTKSGRGAPSRKSAVNSTSSSALVSANVPGNMGPPTHTSSSTSTSSQRGIPGLPSSYTSRSLEHSASSQSHSSSTTRGDESESLAYNPPELLQRSALSNHTATASKLGTGMVGPDANGQTSIIIDERRSSAALAQQIDAAINGSRPGAVPSLLRLDLGNNRSVQIGASSPSIKIKQETPSSSSGVRIGPYGSFGLNGIPVPPVPTSMSASSQAGPIVSYNSSNGNFLPFVQPTSVNEALLNPNPIPFQFNLSQLSQPPTGISPMHSFSSLADQGAWWLSAGGPALTPGQDPNALDEKAQAVAAQQQHELARSGSQTANGTGSAAASAGDGASFDLTAFLNGGVTPGGSFKMDGNTAISGQQSNNNSNPNSPRRDSGSTTTNSSASHQAGTAAVEDRNVLDRWEDKASSHSSSDSANNQTRRNTVASAHAGATGTEFAAQARRSSSAAAAGSGSPTSSKSPPSSSISSLGVAHSPLQAARVTSATVTNISSNSHTNSSTDNKTASVSPSSSHPTPATTSIGLEPMPAINTAKQLLLDGAMPASHGSAMSNLFGESYPSLNIPLKRTLSNALGNGGFDGNSNPNLGAYGMGSPVGVPPTKIFRAATPGQAGAMPIGLDNAESTRAFLQLLERRMAKADGGAGTLGMYENLGFRPPSFVASAAGSSPASAALTAPSMTTAVQPALASAVAAATAARSSTDGAGMQ